MSNPYSFKNFVKKDDALKAGGRVLQVILYIIINIVEWIKYLKEVYMKV